MSPNPVRLRWHRALPTRSLQAAWAVFSDTDRFNRAANLGFQFREELDERGRRVWIGEVRRLGMTLSWVDDPFVYVAPRQFISTRRFRNGPLARLETTMRLSPGPDGVLLDYTVLLFPRSALARVLVQIDAATSIRPMLGKVLDAAASQLGDSPQTYAPPPPLEPGAVQLLGRLRDLPTGPQLERVVREEDLRAQDRLRPKELAARWNADADQVVRDMIDAVGRGVLELRFDLICPRCQGPSQRRPRLDVRPTDLHCASCGIAYDGSFPDSIEVSFRPAPQVRPIAVPLDCANSPAHGRHRLARKPLPPGQEVPFELDLEPGAYRVDLDPPRGGTSLEVREGLRDRVAALDVTPGGLVPAILRVGPGPVTIAVRSRIAEDVGVLVEKRWRPDHVLTAGQLLERPDAHEILPDAALPPSLTLNTRRVGLLVIDGRDAEAVLQTAARRLTHGSERSRTQTDRPDQPLATQLSDGCWVGAYPSVGGALAAARSLVPAARFAMVVSAGAVTLVEDARGVLPWGAAVDEAIAFARSTGVGRLALPASVLEEVEVQQAVQQSGMPLQTADEADRVWLGTPTAPPNVDAPVPRAVGGRYALSAELARGGMGVVHHATDADTGRSVVVKVLSPELAGEPSYAQRFFWEARIAAGLDHPHTVRVLDYGADGPYVWLVMERLVGADLEERLHAETSLHPVEAVDLVVQGLEGLAAAHAQDIVHRDVKPGNLFVCEGTRPQVKVLDFGIAISVYDDLSDEQGLVQGTPSYLSPEQVECGPLDARVDVYAMSIVLYELLCGRLPFQADTSRAMALIRLARDPTPLPDDVDPDLAAIVMKGLSRERDERWPSANAMAAALRKWQRARAG